MNTSNQRTSYSLSLGLAVTGGVGMLTNKLIVQVVGSDFMICAVLVAGMTYGNNRNYRRRHKPHPNPPPKWNERHTQAVSLPKLRRAKPEASGRTMFKPAPDRRERKTIYGWMHARKIRKVIPPEDFEKFAPDRLITEEEFDDKYLNLFGIPAEPS